MKLHRNLAILLTVGAFSAGLMIGCGSDDSDDGAGGASSSSTTSGRASSTISTGSLVVSTSSGGTQPAEFLGRSCDEDSQCGDNGLCVLTEADFPFFDGAPAGGYCTTECAEDSDCEGPDSVCVEERCVLGCTPGIPARGALNSPLDPDKCQGRDDLRCETFTNAGVSLCIPNCGVDSQCGDLACDPRLNVCTDNPTTGLPDGSECSIADEEDPCAGWCIGLEENSDRGMCAQLCTLGGDVENECGGLDKGICYYGLSTDAGAGDLGLCVESCTAHADCLKPDFFCFDVGVPANGYCLFGAKECPRGQADCAEGTVCTETPDGEFCLDDKYPLVADSGTGGAGGAGGGGDGGSGGAGGGTGGSEAVSGTGGSGTGGSEAASGTGGSGTGGSGTTSSSTGGSETTSSSTGGSGTGGSGTGGSGTGGSGTGGGGGA